MAWTYSGDPSSSPKDEVRFLIGDTIQADPLLQDEEINSVLAYEPNPLLAAVICANTIAAKFARLADVTVGKTKIAYNQKAEAYFKLADKLEAQANGNLKPIPYAGGISREDKKAQDEDTDRVEPYFQRDMFKYD